MRTLSNFPLILSLLLITLVLPACDMAKNQLKPDRAANMEIQDFKDALAERLPESDDDLLGGFADTSEIPDLQPYVARPQEYMETMPLVSVSVNQTVPVKDVLYELAEQANMDIELDPGIRGSIIFTARSKPFDEVIERIANIAGLRYTFKNGVLRVEEDRAYNKTYKIDYLSYLRTNSGSVRTDIGVVSGEGADTGSTFEARTESEADFWGELDSNLTQISGGASTGALRTQT